MTLFYTAVKSLECQASWLFERMETMAGELAECSPASTEYRVSTPGNDSRPAETPRNAAVDERIAELERQLAASRLANTELADKLVECEAYLAETSGKLAAVEAEKVVILLSGVR
jgi:uncharacterized coiled-coil protein SlyX